MKKILLVLSCIAISLPGIAGYQKNKNKKQDEVVLKNQRDSIGYAFGVVMAQLLVDDSTPDVIKSTEPDMVIRAFQASVNSEDVLIGFEYAMNYIDSLYRIAMEAEYEKQERELAEEQERLREEAEKFFEENAKEEDVVVMESGLQYKIEKEGAGPKPEKGSIARLKYELTLPDGTFIESTEKLMEYGYIDEPELEVEMSGAIMDGNWFDAVLLMPSGSVYTFYIPHYLSYDMYEGVPYYSPMVCKLELLEVKENPFYDLIFGEDDEDDYYE